MEREKLQSEMCRRRDLINKCIKYAKTTAATTSTSTTTLTASAEAEATGAATTPLTANGATTTGPTLELATKPLTDLQRNHLLKMPTTTVTATATTRATATNTIEKPTTNCANSAAAEAAAATTTTHRNGIVRTLRTLAKSWTGQSGPLLLTVCLSLLVCGSQAGFACLSNPCVFGVCIDGLNSSYSCYCIDGYTGIQCQTNWDECWSGPCQNGGTCVDGVAYYNCTCPEGFSGSNCEENVDECMSNPCQNGGLCRDRNNGYTCTCQPGYLGDHCELDVAVCDTGTGARCQHGGECIEGPGLEFTCECPAGWHGRICQEEINECASAPCQNGGVCVDKLAAYACACPMGYTGVNCEEEILICADNPCQNNALCLMEENVPTCYCVPDYHGEKCEYQYDECQLGPRCMNGGVCIDGVDTFSCSCPPLLTGMLCECLMVGEESLDCNYTAPATSAPPAVPATPAPPPTTLAPPTVRPVTPPETTLPPSAPPAAPAAIETTTTAPVPAVQTTVASSASASSEENSVESRVTVAPPESDSHVVDNEPTTLRPPPPTAPQPEATEEPQPAAIPTTQPPAVSIASSSSSSEESHSIYTTLPPLPAPGVTSSSAESSSEIVTSEEYTTVRRFDSDSGSSGVSSEEAATTPRPTAPPAPPSITIAVDYASSSSSESVEQPSPPLTTPGSIYVHHVTTIDTSISVDYAPPTPTPYFPPETTARGIEEPSVEQTTRRPWSEVPTTAAPFFTDYPAEVLITTHRTSAGRFTTVQPPIVQETTTAPVDYEPPMAVPTTAQPPYIVVTIGEASPLPPITTMLPPVVTTQRSVVQTTNPTTGVPYEREPSTTQLPPAITMPMPVELTTPQPMVTEDLHAPIAPPLTTLEPARETTLPPIAVVTLPPVTVVTLPPVTVVTLPPSPMPTEPPLPSQPAVTVQPTPPSTQSAQTLPPPTSPLYVYSTPGQPELPAQTKAPVTESSSSEETDGTNTVATGGGAVAPGGGGGAEEKSGDVDCIKLGCYNGGTCVTTSEGSRCVCRFDRQGPLCELPIVIRNAAFSGDSYVSHRIYKDIPSHEALDAVLPMHIQLKVRTRATNGLIMLAAAQGTKGGHYMALFLQKGLMQFQFSCGLQTMLLSELETPVNTGHEITIRAELDFSRNYTHCNASLLVNDTLAMSGDQPTWLKLLPPRLHTPEVILNTWLHLGGAPQAPIGLIIELPPAQSGTGFTGCLHTLRINGQAREIFGDALDGFGITECGSLACLSSPCRNGAACIKIESNELDENGDKAEKWKCKCPTGYMGPTCEISVCEDNPCQYGGTCVQFPGSGYLCLCPLGKHGHYCEHNLEVALPSFSGSVNGLSSFVAYTVPVPLEYSLELSFKILPQTMSQISLLAFLGQSGYHDEKSDHLAVSFIQGYIMLTWNLGAGPRRIFTQKPIDFRLDAPRVPYEIKVGRIGRQAWLSVDGKFNITGRSPGSVSRMDVLPILYLGGHEIANFNTLPHDLPLHSGFQGCIYDVNLKAGQVTVPLQETRGVRGRGVGQCGTRECHRHACQHDGACLQHGATFTCICQEGWYGPLCAQPSNPCDSFNNKCYEEATCVPLVNGYECDCPVGRTGKNCEEEIRSLSDVSLTGRRSYLAVRWPYLYDGGDKMGSKRSQMVSYRNFTKKLMPPKPISTPSTHFVMKLLNEVEKQRSFSPVPLMGSKTFEEHHRVQFFFIEFQLRPLSERGLLLYFGTLNNNQDKKIGFVSLSLQGGVVEFRISGPSNHVTVVRSVRMLAIGEWHKIKMAQRGRWLTLWVEGSASSALAPSAEVLVEPDSLLYIGGLKDVSKLPHNAISGFPIPFRGCVRGLVVSGTRIVLNETNIVESRNIRDCDGTACGGDSCESGGHCWLDEKLQPHCICPDYAKGDRCEYSETCKLIPCKNNGRCLRSGRCSCPNGWGGFYCEIALSKPTTPSFRGNSYLILPPPRIPMKDKRRGPSVLYSATRPREAIQISLNFSTIEPDGLLLWSEHNQLKFLGLGLENGHLKLASNLLGSNNDTVQAPASGFIADGAWHGTSVLLDRTRLELQLDGEVIFTERLPELMRRATTTTPTTTALQRRAGKEPTISYEDIFYLGGFPKQESVSKRTQGRFFEPFKGCLQDIQFGAEPRAVISDFSAYQGENIGSCDLHGDEPIVV
ncbi:LOW QUALITY PROTEIN: protein eyes shut [Drosophila nasuta]|uniref:LOW QUALITY PROTEIN: protein eyes shut n=1 Tax=Drosophila nasuta TaxID=42062 RepID=UPI00295EA63B|nr:LOW QUALITY PROTEIN: protein eyes shut [Drosophila nasuta]